MSVPLYMDHHVPDAVTQGLRGRGVDVIATVYEPDDMRNRIEYIPYS